MKQAALSCNCYHGHLSCNTSGFILHTYTCMLFDISSSAIRGAEVVEWVGGKCLENEETNTIANMEFFKKYNFHVNDHNFQ